MADEEKMERWERIKRRTERKAEFDRMRKEAKADRQGETPSYQRKQIRVHMRSLFRPKRRARGSRK